jgi:hypothetical protein
MSQNTNTNWSSNSQIVQIVRVASGTNFKTINSWEILSLIKTAKFLSVRIQKNNIQRCGKVISCVGSWLIWNLFQKLLNLAVRWHSRKITTKNWFRFVKALFYKLFLLNRLNLRETASSFYKYPEYLTKL